ncbi:hypothetical protein, partial [Massilia genomosp. 1]|uniref:hypothetical protein n=1 Tax=Massilia genomosp. 1 TaxID=2609280 RepID=UPI001C9E3270
PTFACPSLKTFRPIHYNQPPLRCDLPSTVPAVQFHSKRHRAESFDLTTPFHFLAARTACGILAKKEQDGTAHMPESGYMYDSSLRYCVTT